MTVQSLDAVWSEQGEAAGMSPATGPARIQQKYCRSSAARQGIRDDGGAGTGREPGGRDPVSSEPPGAASLFSKGSTRHEGEGCPSLILPCSPQPCFPPHLCPGYFQPTTPPGVLISLCFSLPYRTCHSRGWGETTQRVDNSLKRLCELI